MRTVFRFGMVLVACGVLLAEGAAAQGTGRQTVRGQVLDRDAGLPLPGAHVVVLRSDPLRGATTDADGWDVIEGVPLGRQDLVITYIGYEPAALSEVLVTAGPETVLRVGLKEQILTGGEVVVVPEEQKDRPLNDLALVSARSFSVEETRRYAGGLDDPARMASAFAGLTTGGSLSENALIIRCDGGTVRANLFHGYATIERGAPSRIDKI